MKFKGIAIIFFLALVAALAEPLAKPHYKPQDSANIDVYHILKHLFENNEENAEDYLDLSDLNHEEEVSSSEESSSSEEEEQIAPGDLLSAVSSHLVFEIERSYECFQIRLKIM